MNVSRTQVLAAAAIAVSMLAPTLRAGEKPPSRGAVYQRQVVVGDLDLTTDAGRRTLDERLWRAAERVCREIVPLALVDVRSTTRCMQQVSTSTRMRIYGDARLGAALGKYDNEYLPPALETKARVSRR